METGKVGTDQSHMRRLGTTSYLGHGHVTGAEMPQVAYSDLSESLGQRAGRENGETQNFMQEN